MGDGARSVSMPKNSAWSSVASTARARPRRSSGNAKGALQMKEADGKSHQGPRHGLEGGDGQNLNEKSIRFWS